MIIVPYCSDKNENFQIDFLKNEDFALSFLLQGPVDLYFSRRKLNFSIELIGAILWRETYVGFKRTVNKISAKLLKIKLPINSICRTLRI
jgi:hypothetical protein